eukprot:1459088-Pyramimonas_sp.AAC.2
MYACASCCGAHRCSSSTLRLNAGRSFHGHLLRGEEWFGHADVALHSVELIWRMWGVKDKMKHHSVKGPSRSKKSTIADSPLPLK